MSKQESQPATEEFANENIKVHVTRQPNCVIKFDISVQPVAIAAAYQQALKNVSKEVNVPGFRKGKAPASFILDKYGASIEKESVDIALQTSFNEAAMLTHIHPLKDGHMKRPVVKECSKEKGGHFIIEFEAKPHIPTVNPEEIEIKKKETKKISQQEIEDALKQVQMQFATFEPVTDRAAKKDDYVNVTVTILEEPEQKVADNQKIQLNDKGMPHWLMEKVVGLKIGESTEGMTQQTQEDTPNFKSIPFRVELLAISKGLLPEINDELAVKLGLKTAEELKGKIDQRLEQEVLDEVYNEQVHSIEEQLLEKFPIDLPQSYIDENKQSRMNGYLEEIGQHNQKPSKSEYQQIEKMIEIGTVRSLQLYFLKRKIAADNNIEVNDHDITQELTKQVALIPSGRSQIDIYSTKDKMQEQLYNLAMDRRIKDFLIERVRQV